MTHQRQRAAPRCRSPKPWTGPKRGDERREGQRVAVGLARRPAVRRSAGRTAPSDRRRRPAELAPALGVEAVEVQRVAVVADRQRELHMGGLVAARPLGSRKSWSAAGTSQRGGDGEHGEERPRRSTAPGRRPAALSALGPLVGRTAPRPDDGLRQRTQSAHVSFSPMSDDHGDPIAYTALQRGTAIVSSDDLELGTVERVIENKKEHIFDGIVMRTDNGYPVGRRARGPAHRRAPRDAHDRRGDRRAGANELRAGSPRVPRQRARGASQPLLRRRLEAALSRAAGAPPRRPTTAARSR